MALESWILARAESRLRPTPLAGRHGPQIYFEEQNYSPGRGIRTVFLGLGLVAENPHFHDVQPGPPSQNFSLCKQRFQLSVKRVKCRCGPQCVKPGRRLSFWCRIYSQHTC